MLRAKITDEIKVAMKSGDKTRLGTLRLMAAAIQSFEIDAKKAPEDADIVGVLTKMVKQRRDSIQQYTAGGRADLATIEQTEIAVIEAYLPKQMDDAEMTAAIASAIAQTGATAAKDMGRVMAVLKANYAGQMDFQKASAAVKAKLG